MYVPDMFRLDDRAALRGLIEDYAFGLLVTASDGVPSATHLPFLFEPEAGEAGLLRGHLARANPHWRDLERLAETGTEALVVFQGPHAYVSPNDYESDKPNVPTWNYLAVHLYGVPRLVTEPSGVEAILKRLTDRYETPRAEPWRLEDLPHSYIQGMAKGVVAFEIPVARLEAKAKLNQNKLPAQREAAARNLAARQDEFSRETARAMSKLLDLSHKEA